MNGRTFPLALDSVGGGPTTVTVDRDGETLTLDVDMVELESEDGSGDHRVSRRRPADREPGRRARSQAIGVAGQQVWEGIGFTFKALGDMLKPSSLAQYMGVFAGDAEVDEDIRPVSPIGIVNIGTQAPRPAAFLGILAFVNVILATINLLPLFPLDGGHFAVALYEKITGREANVRRLAPVAAAVVAIFAFLGFVAIILDIVESLLVVLSDR